MPPRQCRSTVLRTTTRRTPSRSSDSRRSSRARSRCSSSRFRCCVISRSWRARSSGKNPRRRPWPGRCTRPSRSSRRWWVPGTTSPKAPTISSWRGEEGGGMTERRRFIAKAGGVVAAAAAGAIFDAPNVIAQPKIQWRMSTAWTPAMDVLQGTAQRLAKVVEETSGGRFRIEVFPGGQIMQPFDCFEAASRGTIEALMASSYYWTAKEPAVSWFTSIPFGMNPEGMVAWYYQGEGLKLWEETYTPFNLVPRPAPATAPQMAGWFRKKIATMGDYKGLKMRIGSSLGGKVYVKAGGTSVLIPGAEIYAALERGVIDACEWVGPHDDMKLGLHKTARYYYYPGWQEPGNVNEFGFHKQADEALPIDLRRTLDHAIAAVPG